MEPKIAKVLVASQAQNLDRLFDYQIPENICGSISIGARVVISFQNRPNLGYVWELTETSEYQDLKAVQEVLDNPPLIGRAQYELINWLAEYYFCSRVEVIKLCLPPGANLSRERTFDITVEPGDLPGVLEVYFTAEEIAKTTKLILTGQKTNWSESQWRKKFAESPQLFEYLVKNKVLVPTYKLAKSKTRAKTNRIFRWNADETPERSEAGRRIQMILAENSNGMTAAEICATAEVSSSVLKRLLKEGKIECTEIIEERTPIGLTEQVNTRLINLNSEQERIYQNLLKGSSGRKYLLHGVTGSGKTEIYFEAAAKVINEGGQVLYLVPEIALTPQTLERARNRFGDQVALLHSNMSDGERFDQWFRVKNGLARFVLGARSAVFAPFDKLGLIIIDEEHETTYKQEENPRYHIRQVVEKLATLTGAKVIFGSATPSIETFFKAQTGNYDYLQLNQRYNRNPLPEVSIVDMREELKNGNKNILSSTLYKSITESLANQEQIILLLNRRGHSTFILCRDCGRSLKCPACDVALTYHLTEKNLRCHYCDYRQPVPNTCPQCGSVRIKYFGHGTQKLEEELANNFPVARIIRMDVDSTSKKGSHHQIYRQLTSGSVDILLGTQMIAKGLDLPKVTLVGVISADSTLNIPDFRAAERTFQLLTQVAGRAGRGQKIGKVIFQSYDPEHYSLRFAKEHDYHNFYQEEINHREQLGYPPYSELVRIGFTGLNHQKVSTAAHQFYRIVKSIQQTLADSNNPAYYIEVLGPGPTLIPKVQNKFRWQLLMKSNHQPWLEQLVTEAWAKYQSVKQPDVKVIKDRNPYLVV